MNFGKVWSYNTELESNPCIDVTFVGEELFHSNKEVILSKQFYTNTTFALNHLKIETNFDSNFVDNNFDNNFK